MKKIIRLAHVLRKCGVGALENENVKEKTVLSAAFTVIGAAAVSVLLFFGGKYGFLLFGNLMSTQSLMQSMLLLSAILIGTTAVPAIVNAFYMSSDLSTLLVLPITSGQITCAKMLVIGIRQYTVFTILVLPFCLGYGITSGAGLSFWLGTAGAVLSVPAVLLCLIGIIVMLVMRFFHITRNKDMITIAGALATLVMVVASGVFQNMNGSDSENIGKLLSQTSGIAGRISYIIPAIPFAGKLFGGENPTWLLAIAAIVVTAVALFFLTAKLVYLKGALGMQDTSHNGKALTEGTFTKLCRQRNAVWSYTLKDLKTVKRTPAFLLQGILMTLTWPVLLVIPKLMSNKNAGELDLGGFLAEPSLVALVVFSASFTATLFATALNNTAILSVSREGASYFIMKQLPISYKKQLKAKRNAALVICSLGSTLYLLIGGIALLYLGILPVWTLPFGLFINVCTLFILLDLEMIIGLSHPKLVWESDAEIGRKNGAGAVLFIVGLVMVLVLFVAGALVADSVKGNYIPMIAILSAVFAIAAIVIDMIFYHYGVKKMEAL